MVHWLSKFYGDVSPKDVLTRQKIFEVTENEDYHLLEVYLPFIDKSEMDLGQRNGEIEISVKNEKRCLFLPEQLHGKDITSAKLENGVLAIMFA